MNVFIGLDVSLASTAICVLGPQGKVVEELEAASEPELRVLRSDKQAIFKHAADAQRACDYLIARSEAGSAGEGAKAALTVCASKGKEGFEMGVSTALPSYFQPAASNLTEVRQAIILRA